MSEAPRFRKKPVVIEAMQLDGKTVEVARWLTAGGCTFLAVTHSTDSTQDVLFIDTLEGQMRADPGDWAVRGPSGDFWPVKPDIFAETYEPVEASDD